MTSSTTSRVAHFQRLMVRAFAVVVAVAVGSSCGSDGSSQIATLERELAEVEATSRSEFETESAGRSQAEHRVDELEDVVADQARTIEELEARVAESTVDLATSQEQLSELSDEIDVARRDLVAAEESIQAAEEELENVLNRYDSEIRADAQQAWDAEVTRACEAAVVGSQA